MLLSFYKVSSFRTAIDNGHRVFIELGAKRGFTNTWVYIKQKTEHFDEVSMKQFHRIMLAESLDECMEHYLRVKGSKKLSPDQKKRLYFLWELRETIAQNRDLPPFKILSDSHIISLCQLKDSQNSVIANIIGHRNASRYATKIQEALQEGDQSTIVLPQYQRIIVQKIYGQDIIINQLKEWRSKKNNARGIKLPEFKV